MPAPTPVPPFVSFSPSMRVDLLLSDWRAELDPELGSEEKERRLYGRAWEEYLAGDYAFGRWCWQENDRLTLAAGGDLRVVTKLLGPGRFFGFSHRRAVAEHVPVERVHRPRKGEMSTPRTEAIVLPPYQLLCVYLVRSRAGDARAKAELEIAQLEADDRIRADPYRRFFEAFRSLVEREAVSPAGLEPPSSASSSPGRMRRR